MERSIETQVLALAAMMQAVEQVNKLARGEASSMRDIETCLQSIVVQDAPNAEAIYGSHQQLRSGYKVLQAQLQGRKENDPILARYIMAVFVLERQLSKSKDRLQALGQRIARLPQQLQHFQVTDDTMLASLADIYVEHISSIGSRIQIAGSVEQLKQNSVQNRVRALLLAAIRAAVLWRQAGGRRYHFLLHRQRLLRETNHVLNQLTSF